VGIGLVVNICRIAGEFPSSAQLAAGRGPDQGYLGPNVYCISVEQMRLGDRVFVVCRGKGRSESVNGIWVDRVQRPFSAVVPFKIRELNHRRHIDVVHMHATNGYGYALTRRIACMKPLVVHVHGTTAGSMSLRDPTLRYEASAGDRVRKYLSTIRERIVWGRADRAVAVSQSIADELHQHYGVSRKALSVVHNGVDARLFTPAQRSRAKEQLGLGHKNVVLFVGRLSPVKGVHYLLQAAPGVVDAFENVVFLIVGGPLYHGKEAVAYLEWLRRLSSARSLKKHVRFLGPVSHTKLPLLYSSADIFVMPSIYEGLPKALLEAMACEAPVVATKTGGVPEVLADNVNGLLVEPGNPKELSDSMVKLLSDRATARQFGVNGRQCVHRKFTWEMTAKKLREIYLEVLAER